MAPALIVPSTVTLAQTSAGIQKAGGDGGPPVEFEVATVKLSPPTGHLGFTSFPSGRVEIGGEPLTILLALAFDVQQYQIKGGPDWARTDRYDVAAQPTIAAGETTKQAVNAYQPSGPQRVALQKLLVDRFALKVHIEKRQGPVYILTRESGPLMMQPAKDRSGLRGAYVFRRGDTVSGEAFGTNMTTAILAKVIGADLDRPVIDQTGLTDYYDFHLPPFDPSNTDMALAIFKDMERLGFKLKPGKGPVETVVIDSAQRPIPNSRALCVGSKIGQRG